ncbi:MAG TPA: sulfatase-like hydrolase/transferase, partial [Candidatus Kryptonia bacterium]|nr:sulfatase-like hydrolase/transferase [Candidatus Kryptonia bacterium]
MNSLPSHLRLALSVGVVGGFALGGREALIALQANSFVQPGQYFWLYLVVPFLAWMVLGALLMLPFGVVGAIVSGPREARASLGWYAAAMASAGALSITLPWVSGIEQQLAEVGASVGTGERLLLLGANIAAAGAAAAVAGAAGAWYATRVTRPLRLLRRCVLLIAVVMLWPVVRFFAGDWKWNLRPTAAARTDAADSPDVVLISIDTLRADHLGIYGDRHGLTPNLDQLGREGVVFDHAITSSPWTLPAMASVLT